MGALHARQRRCAPSLAAHAHADTARGLLQPHRTRVFEHLMQTRTETDAFYHLGDIRQPGVLERAEANGRGADTADNPGRLKIRGLRSRGEVEFNSGRNAKKNTAAGT